MGTFSASLCRYIRPTKQAVFNTFFPPYVRSEGPRLLTMLWFSILWTPELFSSVSRLSGGTRPWVCDKQFCCPKIYPFKQRCSTIFQRKVYAAIISGYRFETLKGLSLWGLDLLTGMLGWWSHFFALRTVLSQNARSFNRKSDAFSAPYEWYARTTDFPRGRRSRTPEEAVRSVYRPQCGDNCTQEIFRLSMVIAHTLWTCAFSHQLAVHSSADCLNFCVLGQF